MEELKGSNGCDLRDGSEFGLSIYQSVEIDGVAFEALHSRNGIFQLWQAIEFSAIAVTDTLILQV
jgi:hypothetical protein